MRHGNIYKLLIIVIIVFVIASVVYVVIGPKKHTTKTKEAESLTSSFEGKEEDSVVKNEKRDEDDVIYPDQESIIPDEAMAPELYTEFEGDKNIECYFTNTASTLDSAGFLPLYAQGILTEAAQSWLKDNGYPPGELRCIDGSAQKDSNAMSFAVEYGNTILLFTYVKADRCWQIRRVMP